MDETTSLIALFTSSFLGATLLPGGSEVVLFGVLKSHPQLYWPALGIATLGNTLGGMTSYLIGRFLPGEEKLAQKLGNKTHLLHWTQRHGSPILLLAWAPVIGDILCVAAGWLRINWLWATLFMAAGKLARYGLIASIAM